MENINDIEQKSELKLPDYAGIQGPVLMLNMLRFKDRKHYFESYLPAFREVAEQLGIEDVKLRLACNVEANVLAPESEAWDALLLVEYPSAQAFKTIAESAAYQEIANPHRLEATADLHLYMTTPFEL